MQFFPIYEEVYQVIESQSLPHFLTFAKSNINRPKQIFWYITSSLSRHDTDTDCNVNRYIVGAIDFFIGVVLFLILTLLLSPHNYGFRAIRLPSAIFIFFGTAQYYSATRGFCNQVWGRSSNQVKPWRLDDLDDEEADIGGTTGAGGLQTDSMASDNIITPLPSKDVDITLPNEVHPLADLSGTVNQRSSPLPWETASLPVLEGEPTISDTALRQLALRRATVKIPDASLAFPIAESPAQMHYTTFPKTSTFAMDSIKLSEISPVDTDPDFETKSDLAEPSSQTTKQSQPSISQDLSTLLVRFGRFAPLGIEPTTREKKKIQVFGPENLVEDPRIKRLYQSIVRDILIIAAAASAVWVVLCFAVPMRGLG